MSDLPDKEASISDDIVERFRSVCVACISDAVYGLRLNCIAGQIYPLDSNWSLCGRALTMRVVPSRDPAERVDNVSIKTFIEMADPGDVLVVDCGGSVDHTPFGGHAVEFAKSLGIEGIVIDGAVRDATEISGIGLPTFVRGVYSAAKPGYTLTTSVKSGPVRVGETSVFPGDLVVADRDGIVVVPAARASEILQRAERRHEFDESFEFKKGEPVRAPADVEEIMG